MGDNEYIGYNARSQVVGLAGPRLEISIHTNIVMISTPRGSYAGTLAKAKALYRLFDP